MIGSDWLRPSLRFRMFVVQQIPDSNLVLVVTQAYCDCSRQYGAILLEPKEIKYILHILSSKMLPPAGCLQPQILQGGQDCIQPGKSHLCCNLLIFPQISDAVHWHSTASDENINRLSEQSHNICLLLAEALKLQIYVMLCFYKISSPLYIYFTASFQFSLISVNITPQWSATGWDPRRCDGALSHATPTTQRSVLSPTADCERKRTARLFNKHKRGDFKGK